MPAAVAITGIACIGAPGRGLAAQRAALAAGTSGLRTCDDTGLPLAATLPVARVTVPLPPGTGRTARLALAVGHDALAHAGLAPEARGDCGVVIGSCTVGLPESEAAFLTDQRAAAPAYRHQQSHRLTHAVAHGLRCGGERSTHSVACASAAYAIAEAAEWIRAGLAPCVLVIGADALTRVTMAGFHALMLVDPAGTRPLTRERHGMSLGEGAAALVLEDAAHARARGAMPLASLLGWGMRADGYHATAPDPSGAHLDRCITDCLRDADLAAEAVDYVSAHGTGTVDNDGNEVAVLARRFGAVPTASCKRIYGHTLGASAAIEAVASCLALSDGRRWPSAGAELGTPLTDVAVVRTCEHARVRAVLSTTLAFGGANAALCFGPGERSA